jgi:hypothetical protein
MLCNGEFWTCSVGESPVNASSAGKSRPARMSGPRHACRGFSTGDRPRWPSPHDTAPRATMSSAIFTCVAETDRFQITDTGRNCHDWAIVLRSNDAHLDPEGLDIRFQDPVVRDCSCELLVGVCQLLEERRILASELVNLLPRT